MPQVGEIKKGKEVGYNNASKYIYIGCMDCKRERWVRFVKGNPLHLRCNRCARRASTKNRGAECYLWKGGKRKMAEGYIQIKLQPDDFFYPMASQNGYVLEHRLVMAKHLGRNLHSWEIVHHKGIRCKGIENRSDNLIDNLQLASDDRHKQISILERKIAVLESTIARLEAGER